jgi:hypothetical protein
LSRATSVADSLTEADIRKVGEALNQSGGEFKYLYASNVDTANRFKQMYPGIEVIMLPKGMLPTETEAIASPHKFEGI